MLGTKRVNDRSPAPGVSRNANQSAQNAIAPAKKPRLDGLRPGMADANTVRPLSEMFSTASCSAAPPVANTQTGTQINSPTEPFNLAAPYSPPRLNSLLNIIQYSSGLFSTNCTVSSSSGIIFNPTTLRSTDASLHGIREVIASEYPEKMNKSATVFLPGCGNCAEVPLLIHYIGENVELIAADPLIGTSEDHTPALIKLIDEHLAGAGTFFQAKAQTVSLPDAIDLLLIRHPHPDNREDWQEILESCQNADCQKVILTFTSEAERDVFTPMVKSALGSDVSLKYGETLTGLKVRTPAGRPAIGPDHCFIIATRSGNFA